MDIFKILELGSEYSQLFGKITKYITIAAIPVLIVGIINCFLGYKLFRKMVAVIGAIVISILLSAGYVAFKAWRGSESSFFIMIALAVMGIVIGGFVAYKLYLAGAFCMGFVTGMTGGVIVMRVVDQNSIIIGGVIAGLLMGLLAVDLYKHAIIVMTSINGSMLIAISMAVLLKKADPSFVLKTAIIMAFIGIIVQYILAAVLPDKKPDTDEDDTEAGVKSKRADKKKNNYDKKKSAKKSKAVRKSKKRKKPAFNIKDVINGVKEYFNADDYDEYDEDDETEEDKRIEEEQKSVNRSIQLKGKDDNIGENMCAYERISNDGLNEQSYEAKFNPDIENINRVLSDETVRIDEVQRKVRESLRKTSDEADTDIELILDNNLELIELPKIKLDESLLVKEEEKETVKEEEEKIVLELEKSIIDETMKRLI